MPNKNDLSAIKTNNKNTLKKAGSQVKVGRKPKPLNEKESETVVLKLTVEEMMQLKDKAGLIPLGTYVKHHLRNKTDIFR